tara:strand:+ start:809 stop:1000 length:192 start_codon:yes stop_codon:yes gene_type:complete
MPAPIIQLDNATVATGGQKIATGAQTTAYALNGNPNIDRNIPNRSPPLCIRSTCQSSLSLPLV